MDVVFRNNQLRRCYAESAQAIWRWGPEVGRSYITRINMLSELADFPAAYRVRALRLHPLHGARDGYLSIALTGRWRLIVTRAADDTVIIEEVSNHYDD